MLIRPRICPFLRCHLWFRRVRASNSVTADSAGGGHVDDLPTVFPLSRPTNSRPLLSPFTLCAGMRCQMCEDGYYGDPLGQSGAARPCARCDCNGNVDFNAVGICDHVTGRCLKCLGHTEGDQCQRCRRGFYGDALNQTAVQKCRGESLRRREGSIGLLWFIQRKCIHVRQGQRDSSGIYPDFQLLHMVKLKCSPTLTITQTNMNTKSTRGSGGWAAPVFCRLICLFLSEGVWGEQ